MASQLIRRRVVRSGKHYGRSDATPRWLHDALRFSEIHSDEIPPRRKHEKQRKPDTRPPEPLDVLSYEDN